MFSTCIFCHDDLGRNEAVEHFPVGRRLAFDAAKGRLWVVCKRCARWNLTPLEERWEAIEECERLFRDTRLRVSTDNIGLARIREGTQLVRVGEPQRPEFAAWRYGEQFGRRRRNYRLIVGGGILAGVGLQAGLAGLGAGFVAGTWGWNLMKAGYERLTAVRVPTRHGKGTVSITETIAKQSRFFHEPDTGAVVLSIKQGAALHRFVGDAALRNAAKMFPKVNASGAKREQVAQALEVLERAANPRAPDLVAALLRTYHTAFSLGSPVGKVRSELRLALEMSLHEDAERVAMEGELAELEDRWREAEEIAAISDDLFLPQSVLRAFGALRGGR